MKRGVGCVVAVFVVCLLGGSSADARTISYQEGNTNTTDSGLIWAVKPHMEVFTPDPNPTPTNNWWWFHQNDLAAGTKTAICYSWTYNGVTYAPNGAVYSPPVSGGNATLPAANASICEGPYNVGFNQRLPRKLVAGLADGMVVQYCAEEWFMVNMGTWQNSADPARCEKIRVDTNPPTVSIDLRQGGSSVSTTNSPGTVQTRINYSDSTSPPWALATTNGDNRRCTVTTSACTAGNIHNFVAACSNGVRALTQSFNCPMGLPAGEGLHYECFAVFDGAVLDVAPPTTDPNGVTPSFPDGPANYTLACDTIQVDTTAPNTNITGGPSEGSSSSDTTPTFTFTSSEPTGATFQCKFGAGGTYQSCSSGYTPTLSPGSYAFYVRAIDAVGNVDASPAGPRNFTITGPPDTTPPNTTITATPPATTNDSTPEFSFMSNEVGGTFQCAVDLNAFSACSSPHTTVALSDGSHTFNVYAVDAAGNPDMLPATFTFTVDTGGPPDTTAPDTSITAGPAAGSTINDATPTFSLASSEAGSTFKCKVDSGAFASCSSPHTTAALSNGTHTFSVEATDGSGNTDASPATRSFTVQAGSTPPKDTSAPQTTIKTKPKKSTTSRKAKFTFSSNEAGSTFTCKLDKAPYKSCGSPFSKKVKPGKHKFSVKAKDAAGNTDASAATFSWKVKNKR